MRSSVATLFLLLTLAPCSSTAFTDLQFEDALEFRTPVHWEVSGDGGKEGQWQFSLNNWDSGALVIASVFRDNLREYAKNGERIGKRDDLEIYESVVEGWIDYCKDGKIYTVCFSVEMVSLKECEDVLQALEESRVF